VLDEPTAVRMISPRHLQQLGLSADAALERAKLNTKAKLAGLVPRKAPADNAMAGVLRDQDYAPSLLAFPELWDALARTWDGKLLLAVPGSKEIIFMKDDRPDTAEALGQMAKEAMRKVYRPLSPQVFRWTRQSWIAVGR